MDSRPPPFLVDTRQEFEVRYWVRIAERFRKGAPPDRKSDARS